MIKPEHDIQLNTEQFNRNTTARTLEHEIRWTAVNWQTFEQAGREGRCFNYTELRPEELKGQNRPRKQRPILCIASGVSLNDALPLLKDWEGDTICSTSHASTMVYHGKPPTYIMALDINSHMNEMPIDGGWLNHDSILVTHPGVHPGLVGEWPGRIAAFRKLQDNPPFYSNTQKLMYSTCPKTKRGFDLTATIPSMGSAMAGQMQVAAELGYQPIYLVGTNFAAGRFTARRFEKGSWIEDVPAEVPQDKLVMSENGVETMVIQLYYKRNIISAWRLNLVQCIQTATPTVLHEMPFVPIETVIENQGKMGEKIKGFTNRKIIDTADLFHAKHHIYTVQFVNNGVHYVELPPEDDPVLRIKAYMAEIESHRAAGRMNLPNLMPQKTITDIRRILKMKEEWESSDNREVEAEAS